MASSHSIGLTHATVTVLGLSAFAAVSAHAAPRYVMTPLEHPGITSLVPRDLNDDGRITGYAFYGHGAEPVTRQPFFWQDGTLQLVPVGWDYTEARCLDDNGNAFGIDLTHDAIVHITPEGLSLTFNDSEINSWTNLIRTTTSGHLIGNNGDAGFVWHQYTGMVQLEDEATGAAAMAADINEAGTVVGTINGNSFVDARACYREDGGEVREIAPELDVRTRSIGIDENNRILFDMYDDYQYSLRYAQLSSTGVEIGPPLVILASSMLEQFRTNEAGDIAGGWRKNDLARIGFRAAGATGLTVLTLDQEYIDVSINGLSESGELYGLLLDENYDTHCFVATAADGVMLMENRVIGHGPLGWAAMVRDINASGQMIVRYDADNSYGQWALLDPASPGDANGDGDVDVTDVLMIIDAWGPRETEAVCGPDMDMDGAVDVYDLLEVLDRFNQ